MKVFDIFEQENHLKPAFEKNKFDILQGWDFGWEILETINIADSIDDDEELSKRFSPGQKALYFFWYLDAQVTNGGFIQFYYNDYRDYLPTIKEGLKLIGDMELLKLIEVVDETYLLNKQLFDEQITKGDIASIYKILPKFSTYDETYFKIHDATMELIEKYARINPEEFVEFTN